MLNTAAFGNTFVCRKRPLVDLFRMPSIFRARSAFLSQPDFLNSIYAITNLNMRALAFIMAILGAVGLITGLLGVFGPRVISLSPWLLVIVGFLVFLSGYGLLRKDPDEV